MIDWIETKLGEYVDVINGYAFKSQNFLEEQIKNSLPVVKIKNVANGDVNLKAVQYHLFDKSLEKYLIHKNDVLIALTGNHPQAITQVVGEASKYKLDKLAFLNQRVAKIKAKETMSNDFLYYFLKDDTTHDYLASQSSGSANQANISKSDIENMPIFLPPLEEQKAIAEVLSSLDDKIDLLHRQNQTLEDLAQTLFRQWFIEEAKEEWDVGKLGDYIEIVDNRGKTPPISDAVTEYPIIEVNALSGESRLINYSVIKKYVTEDTYNSWFRSGHPKLYDTLLSTVGSIGEIAMFLLEKGSIAQNVVALRAKNISPFYLYENIKFMQAELKELDIGSVQPSIKVTHLVKIDFIKPDEEILKKFDEQMIDISNKVIVNSQQIQTLENLRDTFLPKLLSGEVRVEI